MDVEVMNSESTLEVKAEAGSPKEEKSTYKSYKKKFRKMRLKFEQKMNQSNSLYKQEQEAAQTAHRLAIETDQLMDLLLDVNNSNHIPGHLRIDVALDTPPDSSVPSLISDKIPSKCPTPETQGLSDQIRSMLDFRLQEKTTNKPTKRLSSLMATVPHAPFEIPTIPYDLATTFPNLTDTDLDIISFKPDGPPPLNYLSPDDVDEYISNLDASLSLPVVARLASATDTSRFPPHLSEKDLAVRNPNSVYNWLRRHEPKIFLQDGEGSEGSKSASGKPGALRGAGKRASLPTSNKLDGTVEFVEEDGMGYDISAGGAAGKRDAKRKRASVDDAGYRPKGGISRPTKRKKLKEGSGDSRGSDKSAAGSSRGRVKQELDAEPEDMLTDNTGPGPDKD